MNVVPFTSIQDLYEIVEDLSFKFLLAEGHRTGLISDEVYKLYLTETINKIGERYIGAKLIQGGQND